MMFKCCTTTTKTTTAKNNIKNFTQKYTHCIIVVEYERRVQEKEKEEVASQ